MRFAAPAPPPGKELSRQLVVTATDPDGQVSVPVTLAQTTSPPRESLPVRIRLEPAQVALVETTSAAVNVVLDNRGGHETVKFNLSGRDPGNEVGFNFEHARVAVRAGSLGYVRLVVETAPVPKGGSDNRPYSVVAVADDGRGDRGQRQSRPLLPPRRDRLGRLHVHPEHLLTKGRKGHLRGRRRQPAGRGAVAGAAHRRRRVRKSPGQLRARRTHVPPGQVARVERRHRAPSPRGRQVVDAPRSDHGDLGDGTISGEATFTQQAGQSPSAVGGAAGAARRDPARARRLLWTDIRLGIVNGSVTILATLRRRIDARDTAPSRSSAGTALLGLHRALRTADAARAHRDRKLVRRSAVFAVAVRRHPGRR